MKILKVLNKKGNILQIVLILFLSFTFFLSLYVKTISDNYELYKNILIMQKQKQYEILLCNYYKREIRDDLLLSDSVEIDDYEFFYQVEVNNNYEIDTYSNHPYFNYHFIVEIDMNTYQVKKIKYE